MNPDNNKLWFFLLYALTIALQCWLMLGYPLFSDEAFYWLEGQHLAWSYAEVPGWAPWLAWLSDSVFPNNTFFARLPHALAAWSLPWVGMRISQRLVTDTNHWNTGLMMLSLPLLMITGILAIPDMWLIFISMLCMLLTIQTIQTQKRGTFILLGITIAIGINIHIRFWLLLLVAALTTLYFYRNDKKLLKNGLLLTAPWIVIGLIPVLLFNLEHDFPLLQFQLKDRHPWSFQADHISFFPIQILLITPLVFVLMLRVIGSGFKHENRLVKLVLTIAIIHWLLYAVLGFFADSLRFNLHWGLISYTLILALTCILMVRSWVVLVTALSGWLFGVVGFFVLMHWQQQPMAKSLLEKRVTHHVSGWEQLSEHARQLLQPGQTLIADQFITASQVAYALDMPESIRVLPHPANIKHGRQQQIDIMGLNYDDSIQDGLVIIEQSALKLDQQADYYQSICELTGGLKLIGHMEIRGIKKYDFFNIESGTCDIPTLFYLDVSDNDIKGWVITDQNSFDGLNLVVNLTEHPITDLKPMPMQETDFLQNLDRQRYRMLGFELSRDDFEADAMFRLCINKKDRTIELSPAFF